MRFSGWLPSSASISPKADYGGWGDEGHESDMSNDSGNWGCETQSALLEDITTKSSLWGTSNSAGWSVNEPQFFEKTNVWPAPANNSFFADNGTGWKASTVFDSKQTDANGNGWNSKQILFSLPY